MTTASNANSITEALSWDSDPSVQQTTALAYKAFLARLPPPKVLSHFDVLDLGCGTGLLSLALAPSVRSVTAVDAAEGMITVLESKLYSLHAPGVIRATATNPGNILAVCALLRDPSDPCLAVDPAVGDEAPGRRFDLVVSHLALHRIPEDLGALFRTVYGLLEPGGQVMVTEVEDFGPEARKFHPESNVEMAGVERRGIEREMIKAVLEEAGFVDVRVERAFEIAKEVEMEPGSVLGPVIVFPFLLCQGSKRDILLTQRIERRRQK
jgi:SAM-dependent methyltransferase